MPTSLRFFKPDSDKSLPDRFLITDRSISPPPNNIMQQIALQKYDLGTQTDPGPLTKSSDIDSLAKYILLKLGNKFEADEEPTLRCYKYSYLCQDEKINAAPNKKTNAVFHFTFDNIFCSRYYSQLRDYCETQLKKELQGFNKTTLKTQQFETTTFDTGTSQTFQISIELELLKKYREKYIDEFITQLQANLIRQHPQKIEETSSILKSRRV